MSTIFRTELKLLLRHWGVWVMAAAGVLLTLTMGEYTPNSLPYWIDESVFRFYVLGPLLLSVAAGRRTQADRVSELIDASPYIPWQWVGARYLANVAVWLVGSLPIWILGLIRFPGGVRILALHWAVTAPITVALLTAMGFFLGSVTRNAMAGYTLAIAYYFAGVFVPMMTDSDPPRPWLWLDWLAPQRWLPLTPTGYFPNTGLVLGNRLTGAGLAAALPALLVTTFARRRRLPVRAAAATLVLALAVAAGAAVATRTQWDNREQLVAAEGEVMRQKLQAAATQPFTATPVSLDQYDLSLTFAPNEHTLAVTGTFAVTNAGTAPLSQIGLTLRSNFTVESLTASGGESLPFERSYDRLTVAKALNPGETVTLNARWKGTVWEWGTNRGRIYQTRALGAHVARESIFLPATYGWYPLPGYRFLSSPDWFGITPDSGPVPGPATFRLTTSGPGLHLLTNAGNNIAGLYVLSTTWPSITADGVELAVAPQNRERALAIYKDLAQRAALLGETSLPTRIVEVPEGFEYGLQVATELQITPGTALVRTYDFEPYGSMSNVPVLSARWWESGPANHGMALGLGAYVEEAMLGSNTTIRWPGGDAMAAAMGALEQSRGRDAAMAVVHELFAQRPNGPTRDHVIDAITRAAQGDPTVLDALKRLR